MLLLVDGCGFKSMFLALSVCAGLAFLLAGGGLGLELYLEDLSLETDLLDDLECLDVFETRFGGVLDLLEAISLDLDLLDLEDLDDFLDSCTIIEDVS